MIRIVVLGFGSSAVIIGLVLSLFHVSEIGSLVIAMPLCWSFADA